MIWQLLITAIVSIITGYGFGHSLGYHDGWIGAFKELAKHTEDQDKRYWN